MDYENYFDKILKKMRLESVFKNTFLMVLYKNCEYPKFCAQMPINPQPPINIEIRDFIRIYKEAIKINPAIHDGAVMVKLSQKIPILTGWCFRLYPPPLATRRKINRGSGYNTILDFSCVENVEVTYFANTHELIKFKKGKEKVLV